jgi:hypothetical protein
MTGNLVSVGTDDYTSDGGGRSLHGLFVQSHALVPGNDTISIEFSISVPFIHRPDDGVWAFQNTPLSNGFIVLVTTLGYPPTPVQHLVSIRAGSAEYPKGPVFRLESAEMNIFRKMETIPFIPKIVNDSTPSCSC